MSIIRQGTSKLGAALRILGVTTKEGEKVGVALRVGEKAASDLTPLDAPVHIILFLYLKMSVEEEF